MAKRWPLWIWRVTLLLACAAVSGCRQHEAEGPSETDLTILVAAASDLQMVLPKLVEGFGRTHPDRVEVMFGASGQLAAQIEQGAPVDLFLSANRDFVQKLADASIVAKESVRPYTVGPLGLACSRDLESPPMGLADLRDDRYRRIAIANPEFAPYGMAARQALQRAGLWEVLQPRLVLAETVRQAQQYVATGNADVAILSLATARTERNLSVVLVDPDLYDPMVQYLGVIASSARRERAEVFAAYLTGTEAQRIFEKEGYSSLAVDASVPKMEAASEESSP